MTEMGRLGQSVSYSLPVVAIVGVSNSGKTTVAAGLIRELISRGHRVAAVKHCPHGHDPSPIDVDSDRLYNAGASLSAAASPDCLTVVERREADLPLPEIVDRWNGDFDLVVAEGYKSGDTPKILVQLDRGLPVTPSNVVAVVGSDGDALPVPHFTPDDVNGLATWIEGHLLTPDRDLTGIRLVVDGVDVPLSRFPSRALSGMLLGFIRSLYGVPSEPQTVEVTISSPAPEVLTGTPTTVRAEAPPQEMFDVTVDRQSTSPTPG